MAMSKSQVLKKAYDAMPDFFTGNTYTDECRALGLDEKHIRSGVCADYLHKMRAIQVYGPGTRTWKKPLVANGGQMAMQVNSNGKDRKDEVTIVRLSESEKSNLSAMAESYGVSMSEVIRLLIDKEMTGDAAEVQTVLSEDACIAYLKMRGYKIYKVVQEEV